MRDALHAYADRERWELPSWVGFLDTNDVVDSSNVKAWLRENWKLE